jgi:hypothetical protein
MKIANMIRTARAVQALGMLVQVVAHLLKQVLTSTSRILARPRQMCGERFALSGRDLVALVFPLGCEI